jgi:hypothetical protein
MYKPQEQWAWAQFAVSYQVLHACADLAVIVDMGKVGSYQMPSGDRKNGITI